MSIEIAQHTGTRYFFFQTPGQREIGIQQPVLEKSGPEMVYMADFAFLDEASR